jgi:signal transduction histidine kinase
VSIPLLDAAARVAAASSLEVLLEEIARSGLRFSDATRCVALCDDLLQPELVWGAFREGELVSTERLPRLPNTEGWLALPLGDHGLLLLERCEEPPTVRLLLPHFAAALSNATNYAMLERLVEREMGEAVRREEAIRVILDSMQEGLLVCDLTGKLTPTRSRVVVEWFGEPREDELLWNYLTEPGSREAAFLELGMQQMADQFLPFELLASQMPARISRGDRLYEVHYLPVFEGEAIGRVLLTILDVTSQAHSERSEQLMREMPGIVQNILQDESGFLEFLEEAEQLLGALPEATLDEQRALLHTLKGSAAVFGFQSFSRAVHALEDDVEAMGELEGPSLAALAAEWAAARAPLAVFLREGERRTLQLSRTEHQALLEQLEQQGVSAGLLQTVRSWVHPPLSDSLERYRRTALVLASRLGKSATVQVDTGGLRLPRAQVAPFLSALVHVFRNAVDHGLEPPDVRLASGKSEQGRIEVWARMMDGALTLTISDDGRGIPWDGLAQASPEEVLKKLCSGSTAACVSEISGRGVGMSAVCATVRSLGGRMSVESAPGAGTRFHFVLPIDPS